MVPTSEQGRQIFTQIPQTNLDTVREILKEQFQLNFMLLKNSFSHLKVKLKLLKNDIYALTFSILSVFLFHSALSA